MKTSLEHLSPRKRQELERITAILFEELEDALKLATSDVKKRGRILKVILFGSYARGDFVEDRSSGYFSDIDLLVVVNQARLTDVADIWYKADDRFLSDPRIKTEVNLIVHTLDEVNDNLAQGQYFFSDIVKDGVALFQAQGIKFASPRPLDEQQARELGEKYWAQKFDGYNEFLRTADFQMEQGMANLTAFSLHQAAEQYYQGVLLRKTLYSPASHNIKFLRSLAEDLEPSLRTVWPRDTRAARANFELLKRAYVDARYSEHFDITKEQLTWLRECVGRLDEGSC